MRHTMRAARRVAVVISLVLAAPAVGAAEPQGVPESFLQALVPRSIGPANMGGRIVDIAVAEQRPSLQYVASATGGLWKTESNGTSWEPVFDKQPTLSLGAVAVAPSDPNVVWVGTGEPNARNSVSWGNGVYRSTDGGKTWAHRGLKETHHIGRIVIHPRDPEVVYVAAVGHFWAPNKERGLYKTADGGKTWVQSLSLDDETGCVDLVMDPRDPQVLYASAYRVRRDAFSGGDPAVLFGDAAGLYKTIDGGKSWVRLRKGLPERPLGRCALSVWRKDPRVLYAVVHTDKTSGLSVLGQSTGNTGKVETGGVFRSDDRGETWTKLNDLCPRPFYFGQIRVDPTDDQRVYVLGLFLHASADGGKTFKNDAAKDVHPDHHALWIDPADPRHLIDGCDGGLHYTYDRGAHWEQLQNLPIGQFYAVGADLRKPYEVYGGLQDNGSWRGPSRTRRAEGIGLADWTRIYGADGFYTQVDPKDPDTAYAEGQYGMLGRVNLRTGRTTDIRPTTLLTLGLGGYRFNWNAPILISPHQSKTIYYGGNYLFRSVNRGDKWETLTPDLTKGKPPGTEGTGQTITTIAESPLKAGVLYFGTDDGRLFVSRDGGKKWTDVSANVPGLPPDRWITRIECSPFEEGSAYLTVDRHRNDDLAPYVFRTDDYGSTWKSLAGNLPPEHPVHVIRADGRRRGLLFAGTEFGLFFSIDEGKYWQPLRNGLPAVSVHDLLIHPRERELVIGTHGRSLYILDVAPLEQLSPEVLASPVHLFEVKPATAHHDLGPHGLDGPRTFLVPNPPFGATIYYHLKDKPAGKVQMTILGANGRALAQLTCSDKPGLQSAQWNLQTWAGLGPLRESYVPAGEYTAQLQVGEQVWTKKFRVEVEE